MSKELRYLSFMGGNSKKARLLGLTEHDQQRQQLATRAAFIHNAKSHPEIYSDPVLRHHLGLDPNRTPTDEACARQGQTMIYTTRPGGTDVVEDGD